MAAGAWLASAVNLAHAGPPPPFPPPLDDVVKLPPPLVLLDVPPPLPPLPDVLLLFPAAQPTEIPVAIAQESAKKPIKVFIFKILQVI